MLELGTESKEEHQKIMNHAKNADFEQVITVGEEFKSVNRTNAYSNIDELKENWNWSDYQDVFFLIKGSRGIRLEKLLLD